MDFKNLLENAKDKLGEYADFAVRGITHICSEIGPRECGSENERKAQEYMGETLKNYADTVTRETFSVHPRAFMSFVPLAGGMLLASTYANIVGAFKKNKFSAASVPLLGATLASVVGEFGLYKKPLDPLFPKKESVG